MILSFARPFNKKIGKQLIKTWKKKNNVSYFSILSIDDTKVKKKTLICFVAVKVLNYSQNTTIFTPQAESPATILKINSETSVFL